MPLVQGFARKAIAANILRERAALRQKPGGKERSQKDINAQALAIALHTADEAKKKAGRGAP